MKFIETKELSEAHKKDLLDLWNREYPVNLAYHSLAELEAYLEKLGEPFHILLQDEKQNIKGWCFSFWREEERWFAIILDANIQGKGYGRKFLEQIKEKETILNGWVIDKGHYLKKNGEAYRSPLAFYLKNGFHPVQDQRLELDTISALKIQWIG